MLTMNKSPHQDAGSWIDDLDNFCTTQEEWEKLLKGGNRYRVRFVFEFSDKARFEEFNRLLSRMPISEGYSIDLKRTYASGAWRLTVELEAQLLKDEDFSIIVCELTRVLEKCTYHESATEKDVSYFHENVVFIEAHRNNKRIQRLSTNTQRLLESSENDRPPPRNERTLTSKPEQGPPRPSSRDIQDSSSFLAENFTDGNTALAFTDVLPFEKLPDADQSEEISQLREEIQRLREENFFLKQQLELSLREQRSRAEGFMSAVDEEEGISPAQEQPLQPDAEFLQSGQELPPEIIEKLRSWPDARLPRSDSNRLENPEMYIERIFDDHYQQEGGYDPTRHPRLKLSELVSKQINPKLYHAFLRHNQRHSVTTNKVADIRERKSTIEVDKDLEDIEGLNLDNLPHQEARRLIAAQWRREQKKKQALTAK